MKRNGAWEKSGGPHTGVRISRSVKAAGADLVSMRGDFHRHPELAFNKKRTAAIVSGCLREWGYEIRDGIAGTGVCGYLSLENDHDIARIMKIEAAAVVGEESVVDPGLQMTAEDMSYFLKKVPGCFFFVGSHDPSRKDEISHHNPQFDFDEDAMLVGVEMLLRGVRALSSVHQGQ